MHWAALTTCFFGFLRVGEVCSPTSASYGPSWQLCNTDIALDSNTSPTKLFITIKAFRLTQFIRRSSITLGKTGRQLCHMVSTLSHIAQWGSQPGPLFHFRDGSFFMQERFVREGRHLLTAAGTKPTPYSGHSFRIGAAPTAAHAGLDAALIQTVGW